MVDWQSVLHAGARDLGLEVSAEQEALFARYLALLLERSTQVNLTAITDPVEVAAKHFLDALTVEMVWQPQPGDRVIDIGTGAGIPGVPLAIRHPEVKFTLNDSTRKKITFLEEVASALPLPNIHPLWARAEALGRRPECRGRFTTVLARAVAHLGLLIEYALPLLAPGGTLIAMKGPVGEAEIAQSQPALQALHGEVTLLHRLSVAGAGERLLIVIHALAPPPAKYPRDAGSMKKRPLYLDRPATNP
ncbi:MAG: 16S rRNA (guanine(527)-N(7))-methyltransferase RsmG [Armatimonadota bacterium]